MRVREIFKLILLIQNRRTTYHEIYKFLFRETPPENHDFLFLSNPLIAEMAFSDTYNSPAKIKNRKEAAEKKSAPNKIPPYALQEFSGLVKDYINLDSYKESLKLENEIIFSVVVCTYNGVSRIIDALVPLIQQEGIDTQQVEIIVVNDGSKDDTKSAVAGFIHDHREARICYVGLSKNYGPSIARNVGIQRARGTFVCFTDDDCIAPKDWLAVFYRCLEENPEVAGVGGWYSTHENSDESIFDKYLFWRHLPNTLNFYKSVGMDGSQNLCGNTANVCYRRSALVATGGFNPVFYKPTYEDWELKIRMHRNYFPLLFSPHMVHHIKSHTLHSFARYSLMHGWGRFLVYKIHGNHVAPVHYNLSLMNIFMQLLLDLRKVFLNLDTGTHLTLLDKIKFAFVETFYIIMMWFGQYLIPIEILSSRRRKDISV